MHIGIQNIQVESTYYQLHLAAVLISIPLALEPVAGKSFNPEHGATFWSL